MDETPDPTRPTLRDLRAELDRSRNDLAAGRVRPLGSVLTSLHERASRRIERRQQAGQAEEKIAEPS